MKNGLNKMIKFILKIFLINFAYIYRLANAMYYCTHFVYESGQNLCPPSDPPLIYYASVHLCCKDNSDLGTALIYRTFETEPPKTFPQGCTPALHEASIGQYVCKSGEDAYSNWDPTFAEVIPVCCQSGTAPPLSLKIVTAHFGPAGQRPSPSGNQGTGGLQPLWPWPPHWANAGAGGGSRHASYNSNSVWPPSHSNHIGGGRGCKDWISYSGTMSCAEKYERNYCTLYANRMQIQCPVTCGFC